MARRSRKKKARIGRISGDRDREVWVRYPLSAERRMV
jgi:hypothetical protein